MPKTIKIYIGILILLFVAILAVEFSRPEPINWSKTYNETHTIPYGTFVLYNEFENLFPQSEVIGLAQTPYEYFGNLYDWDEDEYTIDGAYLYIDEKMTIDDVSAQELLDFAQYGNTVFISSNYFPDVLIDSLKFELDIDYDFSGKTQFSLANPRFINDSIHFDKGISNIHFEQLDSTITTVLGYQKFSEDDTINFIKVIYGQGEVYLHLQPIAFTNYNLLKNNNKKYVSSVLAYLPDDTIYYDSRNKKRYALGNSPLRYILSQPALRWAWYIALIAVLVFVAFNAKRKQRIVDVIKPLENTTVAFTKTIGNLYYETKDHTNIINKKIVYFLEYLRRTYYLDTQILDEKFAKNLALKSGRDLTQTKRLINYIAQLRAKSTCTENELITLNKIIENFHTNTT